MRVIVGMSGGVDSAVTALVLKHQGHDVVGVTMNIRQLGRYRTDEENGCFSINSEHGIDAARRVCEQLDIDYHVFDCADDYEREILDYFRDEYLAGRTPNPCVRCNRVMKFGLLPKLALDAGIEFDKFATGHYARIVEDTSSGKYKLFRAIDRKKDQSYFLYNITYEQLSRQLFPLGELTKDEVRQIAKENALIIADKTDSQDFYQGDRSFILDEKARVGNIVDLSGKVLGKHNGYWNYTVGQRKGLCISNPVPLYVYDIKACSNEIVVAPVDLVVKTSLIATDMNWLSIDPPREEKIVGMKIRSVGEPIENVTLMPLDNGDYKAVFPQGIKGVARGQSAVFFDGDLILGGGIIKESL